MSDRSGASSGASTGAGSSSPEAHDPAPNSDQASNAEVVPDAATGVLEDDVPGSPQPHGRRAAEPTGVTRIAPIDDEARPGAGAPRRG